MESRIKITLLFTLLFISSAYAAPQNSTSSLSFNQQLVLLSVKVTPVLIGMYLVYEYFEGHHKTRALIKNTHATVMHKIVDFKDSILRMLTHQDEKINSLQQQIDALQQALINHGIMPPAQKPSLVQRLFGR